MYPTSSTQSFNKMFLFLSIVSSLLERSYLNKHYLSKYHVTCCLWRLSFARYGHGTQRHSSSIDAIIHALNETSLAFSAASVTFVSFSSDFSTPFYCLFSFSIKLHQEMNLLLGYNNDD